ncbi:MAG: hypothetical protein WCO09_00255 [bacterium]
MKKILIASIVGALFLIAIVYLRFVGNTSTFDRTSLIIGSSCKSIQGAIIPIPKEKSAVVIVPYKESNQINTPMYTGYVPKLSTTKPFIERLYLRIIVVLMEVLALYLNYIKGKEF